MKIIGIDYGDTRTGLAISDSEEKLAFSIGAVSARTIEDAARLVTEKIVENHAEKAVLGLPKNMDGSEGFRAEKTRKFAAALAQINPLLPIDFLDERLTTKAATFFLNETNTRGKKRKNTVDTVAAQIILQDYLDKNRTK